MVRQNEGFANKKCPKDCPFLFKLGDGQTIMYCAFAEYADILEPGRHTRTEIKDNGEIDYNIPPHCGVYKKYKNEKEKVERAKHELKTTPTIRPSQSGLVVTGHVHYWKKRHR